MNKSRIRILLAAALVLLPLYPKAADKSSDSSPSIKISIGLSVEGLQQSSQAIANFGKELNTHIQGLDASQLNDQQLQQLQHLIDALNNSATQSQNTLDNLPQTLRKLNKPLETLATTAAQTLNDTAIDPLLDRVNTSIYRWLGMAISGGVLLLLLGGAIVYISLRQVRRATEALYRVGKDYRLVHVDRLAQNKPATSHQTQQADEDSDKQTR